MQVQVLPPRCGPGPLKGRGVSVESQKTEPRVGFHHQIVVREDVIGGLWLTNGKGRHEQLNHDPLAHCRWQRVQFWRERVQPDPFIRQNPFDNQPLRNDKLINAVDGISQKMMSLVRARVGAPPALEPQNWGVRFNKDPKSRKRRGWCQSGQRLG
jgi:hypothetical protein